MCTPDGLLDVNPQGKHPILELIERSVAQWKSKLDRRRKTLYKRGILSEGRIVFELSQPGAFSRMKAQ